jgi:hypothetical protein
VNGTPVTREMVVAAVQRQEAADRALQDVLSEPAALLLEELLDAFEARHHAHQQYVIQELVQAFPGFGPAIATIAEQAAQPVL